MITQRIKFCSPNFPHFNLIETEEIGFSLKIGIKAFIKIHVQGTWVRSDIMSHVLLHLIVYWFVLKMISASALFML